MSGMLGTVLGSTLALLVAGQVQAAITDTTADTLIENTASVTFTIGGVTTPKVDGKVSFKVDHKIRPLVAAVSGDSVVPEGLDYVLQFTVTNDGNTKTGETLEMLLEALPGAADYDMTNVEIWQEDGTSGGYQIGEDTKLTDPDPTKKVYINLERDAVTTIYIVADAEADAANGEAYDYHLRATATDGSQNVLSQDAIGDNPGSNDANESEAVFADSNGTYTDDIDTDGEHSALATYTVYWPVLNVTKTASIDAGDNGSGYYLPGDIVTYTIEVLNEDGSNGASGVIISDPIPANTTYHPASLVCTGLSGSTATVTDDGSGTVTDVSCEDGSIAASAKGTMIFKVKIN